MKTLKFTRGPVQRSSCFIRFFLGYLALEGSRMNIHRKLEMVVYPAFRSADLRAYAMILDALQIPDRCHFN